MKPLLPYVVALYVVISSRSIVGMDIPLEVEEPVGAARSAEVVSGGIPLPKGAFKDPTGFSLFDGDTEVPVQVSPIVKYPDGSLHWALVSFPVTLDGNQKKSFVLKDGRGRAAVESPVEVKEDGAKVTVSNGIVSFTIDREDFNCFESINYRGSEVFKAAKAALTVNGKGGPGKLTHFAYYYRGPVQTTLYLKGTYDGAKEPTWSMVVTLCAGESRIWIEHNVRNGGIGAPKRLSVGSPMMRLGIAGELTAAGSGGSPGKAPAYGWQAFTGVADVLVFMRHGGQAVKGGYTAAAGNGEMSIGLGGDMVLPHGAHKSTEIDIVFGKAAGPEALAEPLHARAACAWYAAHDTMGIGRWYGSLEDETATYKAWGWKNAGDAKKMPDAKPNPGAYHTSLRDAHFKSECDHLRGMVFAYLRTGQRGFLDESHAWARTWKAFLGFRSNEWVYGRDGSFRTAKWGKARMCTEGCHFYMTGLFNYALITGNIDALEAAFDGAEFANLSWTGQYSKKKPGDFFAKFGSRAFSRCYNVVARAYDVARSPEWKPPLHHYVKMLLMTPGRDPRGFTNEAGRGAAKRAAGRAKKFGGILAEELFVKEKVTTDGETLTHPVYGTWAPRAAATWPEPIMAWSNMVAYEALSASSDPADRLLAEDVMDYAIAQARFGERYAFNRIQKAVYYKLHLDYPIPDFIPAWCGGPWEKYGGGRTDSHYTKWWPNVLASGYRLTGDPSLLEICKEVTWWGLSRDYVKPPSVPQGDAPRYARIENNTKGDWMSTTCVVFGLVRYSKEETAAPVAVTDLRAKAKGNGTVQLTWTAPGDEGGGSAKRYQLKYSEKPMVDYLERGGEFRKHFKDGKLDVDYWNMAVNVAGEPVPQAKGKTETMTVSVSSGKTVHFAVRTFDDSHNRSAISNVVKVVVQ